MWASSVRGRRTLLAGAALTGALMLAACGGSSVSDAIPKSTPDIIPPANTSAEKAALSATSTSTTKTTTTSTAATSTAASPTEATKSESTESSSTAAPTGAGGGTSATIEKEKTPATTEGAKGTEVESEASPTGGASAP
jgi:hypothetical protein